MKENYTYEEVQLLKAIIKLSPVARVRIERLMLSWIERNKKIRESNNVIPFRKRIKNEK